MIPFNKPPVTGYEAGYLQQVLSSEKMCGGGPFCKKCQVWFEQSLPCHKALLTPSCTHALEMAALLIDLEPGDEVIMPSYTFVSTANPFVLRGAKVKFVDVRADTMNIDETQIEAAITDKTKAIVVVHYAGIACEMDTIMALADEHDLFVIEDAAQGMKSSYNGKSLGTIGHLGAFSFHETKNYTSGGEGGLLLVNDPQMTERAEVIREKGTNRSKFLRGMVDKYSWVDIGSSYLPSELQAGYLYAQLEQVDVINDHRLSVWQYYQKRLNKLAKQGYISLPVVPAGCQHNAHMFYIKTKSMLQRSTLIEYLKINGVGSAFHYVPLHSALAGEKFTQFVGEDKNTTFESERLLRLPLWYPISESEVEQVCCAIENFYES
jgi:dTDP-4-amino-4,6-dideoxygalactose transaminase